MAPLRRGSFTALIASGDVYAFLRGFDADSFVVALNRGNAESTVSLPLTGRWKDELGGMVIEQGSSLSLQPRSGVVLVPAKH
jgi:hypothetical protein